MERSWRDPQSLVEMAENKSVSFDVRMACEARRPCVVNRVLGLSVPHESFESPPSRGFVSVGIPNHHVNSSAVAFEDCPVLLLGFAQLVYDHGAIGEVTR